MLSRLVLRYNFPLQIPSTISTCSTLDQDRSWPDKKKSFKNRKYTAKVGQDDVNIGAKYCNNAFEIQPFKNVKINKEMFGHPDADGSEASGWPDMHFFVNFDIFQWLYLAYPVGSRSQCCAAVNLFGSRGLGRKVWPGVGQTATRKLRQFFSIFFLADFVSNWREFSRHICESDLKSLLLPS